MKKKFTYTVIILQIKWLSKKIWPGNFVYIFVCLPTIDLIFLPIAKFSFDKWLWSRIYLELFKSKPVVKSTKNLIDNALEFWNPSTVYCSSIYFFVYRMFTFTLFILPLFDNKYVIMYALYDVFHEWLERSYSRVLILISL